MWCQCDWRVVLVAILTVGEVLTAAILERATNTSPRLQDCEESDSCVRSALGHLSGTFQILPGVNLSSTYSPVNSTTVSGELKAFLKSLTVHIAIYDDKGLILSRNIHNKVLGRASNKRYRYLSIYVVLGIAFVILSALIGKAMSLSIVALVIAIVTRANLFAGLAANSPANTPPLFDIVRRPQVQIAHTQSAEEVYESPGTGMGNGVSYVYPLHKGRASTLGPYTTYIQPDSAYSESQVREPPVTEGRQEEPGYHITRESKPH